MKKINRSKVTTKQSDKNHVLIRFGANTIFEYYSDASRNEWKLLIFNYGYRND